MNFVSGNTLLHTRRSHGRRQIILHGRPLFRTHTIHASTVPSSISHETAYHDVESRRSTVHVSSSDVI